MKFLSIIFLILIFTFCAFSQTVKPSPSPTPLTLENVDEIYGDLEITADGRLGKIVRVTGKIVDVHDGDTIRLLDDSKTQYKCRFNGIDAPELKQDFGNRSKQSLSDMVFGKLVTIEYDKIDKYGRFVCKILLDGMDVNLEQIKRGMAWHYKKYQDEQTETDRKLYSEAEIKAREQKLGLWAQPNATPPWDWRRGTNNPNLEGVPSGSIIGNTNSKIYHTPGCSSYAKVSPQNRIVFKDEKEAIAKGYRLSGQCESTLPIEERPKQTKVERKYIRGPRGGCYYLNDSGKKTYVDKSLCN